MNVLEGNLKRNNSYDSVSNAMRMYLNDIEGYEMLTAKEEVELAKQIVNSSSTAKEEFINSNYRLVVSIAKKYKRESMDMLDLIQAGNIGLIKAVDKYDYKKGFKFSTYATWWIRQSITRYIDDCEYIIRLPVHLQQKISMLKRKKQEFVNIYLRDPNVEELADYCDLDVDKVTEVLNNNKNIISLDSPIKDDEDGSLVEFIPSDDTLNDIVIDEVEKHNLQEKIDEVLSFLTDQEEEVLRSRFGLGESEPKTLEEIGKIFGVTRERIRQIEAKALRKLRHPSKLKQLENFY
ncbi:sigma-70 family RNA polymerase sigma factor [Metaclostridioides mangenotii]|uniref:RNA polymerase sigma factor n=1 Tax=Metaclostridioides mangenotii TaxID=1540 RepID=A0ABS4E8Q0_9FIRM|nr:RNA polymerase sigma factor RpoD/SigA [Clostridioides mangenotii]MBP1854321.1 RNA polymerase primary sigma factor [Clostridioides mangenotii]